MNDPKFTEKLKKWFDCEHTDANIREGALLLLRMNNNRHLYQLINFDPQGKLELLKYELQKHLNYRIEGMTIDDVRNYARQSRQFFRLRLTRHQRQTRLPSSLPLIFRSWSLKNSIPSCLQPS